MSSSDGGDLGVQFDRSARRRRRSYSEDEKQRLVAESCEPGASVSSVAQRHAINANLLFTWRRQMRPLPTAEATTELIPVEIGSAAESCPPGRRRRRNGAARSSADRRRSRSCRRERQRSGAEVGSVGAEGDDMIAPGPGVRVYLSTTSSAIGWLPRPKSEFSLPSSDLLLHNADQPPPEFAAVTRSRPNGRTK